MTRLPCVLMVVMTVVGSSVCAQTFFKTLGQPGRNEQGLVLYHSPANDIFLGGSAGDSAMVQRLDATGNVLWTRTFKPPGQ